jgi:hypothetical protein
VRIGAMEFPETVRPARWLSMSAGSVSEELAELPLHHAQMHGHTQPCRHMLVRLWRLNPS